MTTIVTRAYKDLATARSVVEALRAEGFPERSVDLIAKGDADAAGSLAAAKVPAEAAGAFARAAESGKPVVVARAEITPFGAAATAKQVMGSFNPVAVEGTDGDYYVSTVPMSGPAANIRTDHGHIFTRQEEIAEKRNYRFSAIFGWKLLSDRKPAEGVVYRGTKHFTDGWFGGLLSSRKPAEGTIKKDHPHMSKAFWPAPLLSDRKPPSTVVMKDHPHMSQRFWPAPLLSER